MNCINRVRRALTGRFARMIDAINWHVLKLRTGICKGNKPGTIHLGGYQINFTDLKSLYIEYKDIFRQKIYEFTAKNDRPRIIDGGGCIGMSVLNFKRQYPNAKVICFEPDNDLLDVLNRNIEQNMLDHVEVVPAGLAGFEGQVSFAADGVDGGKIVDDAAATKHIDVVRLSDYLNEPADFVKLNIEGMELDVLKQVAEADKLKNIREMVIEYHGWPGEQQKLGQILSLLDTQGFRYLVHDFDKQTNAATKPPFRYRPKATWFCLIHAIQPIEQTDTPLRRLAA